jgi:hypothetical protein
MAPVQMACPSEDHLLSGGVIDGLCAAVAFASFSYIRKLSA